MSQTSTASGKLRAEIAEEVRALLGRRRMSDIALARTIERSHTYVYRRLAGETAFDADDLEKIAEALGVNVVDLLPRSQRGLTAHYSTDKISVVPGYANVADHLSVALPVRLPMQATRTAVLSASRQQSGPYSSSRKTAPTGL